MRIRALLGVGAAAHVLFASLAAAQTSRVEIGPVGGGIHGDATTAGSFVIENQSAGATRIVSVRFDVSTAILPDLVFDPIGTAGDTFAKDFTEDSGGFATGFTGHTFLSPKDGGFSALELQFTDFDPGEVFTFSIDVDPTSIQGAIPPGPHLTGLVSGLELSGSSVEVTYEGPVVQTGRTFSPPLSAGWSEAFLQASPAPAPAIEILGVTTPATVFAPVQVVRVTGTPGQTVLLRNMQAARYLDDIANGGFDIDPYEANTAVSVDEYSGVVGGGGTVDIPITLLRTEPAGGLNTIYVAEVDSGGLPGLPADAVVVELVDAGAISFTKKSLLGTNLTNPTSLQFGPDNRLYVAEQDGEIRVLTIYLAGGNLTVAAEEVIGLIQSIPNHDDDGTPNPSVNTRLVTGLVVGGTPTAPVVYVSSSDPRMGGGSSGAETDLDTNSGVVSRLTLVAGVWEKLDIVRGLPRSEGNHATNGMQLDEAAGMLYLCVAGNTNMGAPSFYLAQLPEFALSAAILSIDLTTIGATTYDLPTLDDEDRTGTTDANDPFGGNDGKNQARLVFGGPVQVHSPGWRNTYDIVITQQGRMYGTDNGPNAAWGDIPIDNAGICTNAPSEPGQTHGDQLHFVSSPGFYAGHPNPTRASTTNTFNTSNPQSPVPTDSPGECTYDIPGATDGALVTWGASTNGVAEYRASYFGAQMLGDIIAVSIDGRVQRVKPNATGETAVLSETLFTNAGAYPLDVTTRGDGELYGGSIWVANYVSGEITIFEPVAPVPCSGADNINLDEDADGYSNADEIDNGTDPCSAADVPADFDGDALSDLNDPDDDQDGIPDLTDLFALDPFNGSATILPLRLAWDSSATTSGGLMNLGFTGLMNNGVTDYLDQFDPGNMTGGGAAGVLTVDLVPPGTATAGFNDQEYGFQIGMVMNAAMPAFVARTRLVAPFAGLTPGAGQEFGLFVGTGGQDDFTSVVIGSASVLHTLEQSGTPVVVASDSLVLPGPDWVELSIEIDPVASTMRGAYEVPGTGKVYLSGAVPIPAAWLAGPQPLALGVIGTSRGSAPFPATWDFLEAVPITSTRHPIYRINAGGASVLPAGDGGPDWILADGFVTNSRVFRTGAGITVDPSVPPGTPTEMFQSERWDVDDSQEMTWTFPVPGPGVFEARLYFAEIFTGAFFVGARTFDVVVEDIPTLDTYDIFDEFGGNTGGMESAVAGVVDGAVTIELLRGIANPKINGIEILRLGELDCNANGVGDTADISSGTSLDCNSNGIPDECELGTDCNTNGVPDDCEADCDCDGTQLRTANSNSVPDECDISGCESETWTATPTASLTSVKPTATPTALPDDCETDCTAGTARQDCNCQTPIPDCKSNDIPDGWREARTATPIALPDECEPDCNSNGIAGRL